MASTESAAQDQKKRSLEALERRFAVAKAEILQQQKRSKKSNEEQIEKEPEMVKIDGGASSSGKLIDAGPTPSMNTPSKRDVAANDPSYSRLSLPVHDNLLSNNVKMSSRKGSIVDKILHELLQNGDSAQKYMQGSRSMKIDSWIPLDNYVKKQNRSGARMRALQIHSRRSKSHMSMKQHKRCGSLDLPKDLHKFDIYKPMHDMWKDYMTELLKTVGKNQLAQVLLTADLHGAIIIVADCKITSFTGVSGIMIRETAETFGMITQDDKFRVVPKKVSVFIFQVDSWKVTLHGDKLISRDLGL